jgi:hypothetical protein
VCRYDACRPAWTAPSLTRSTSRPA